MSLFKYTALTEIYTLSLHDALPISGDDGDHAGRAAGKATMALQGALSGRSIPGQHGAWGYCCAARHLSRVCAWGLVGRFAGDRKSTRLNSSHLGISYAVFCLKKKKR